MKTLVAGEFFDVDLVFLEVVEAAAARHFLRGEGDVVVVVEVGAVGRDPLELPAHALLEGLDLGERRARDDDERDVVRVEVRQHAVDAVAEERAADAAFAPAGAEHEVVDDQLAAAVEEVGERLAAVRAVEDILLLDSLPRQFAALSGEGFALPGEGFFLAQQLAARGEPFFVADDLWCVDGGGRAHGFRWLV